MMMVAPEMSRIVVNVREDHGLPKWIHAPDHSAGRDGPQSWPLDGEIEVVYLSQEINHKPYVAW